MSSASVTYTVENDRVFRNGAPFSWTDVKTKEAARALPEEVVNALYSGLARKQGLTIGEIMILKVFQEMRATYPRRGGTNPRPEAGLGALRLSGMKLAQSLSKAMSTVENKSGDLTSGEFQTKFKTLGAAYTCIQSVQYNEKPYTRNNFARIQIPVDRIATGKFTSVIIASDQLSVNALELIRSARAYQMTNGTRQGAWTRLELLTPKKRFDRPLNHLEKWTVPAYNALPVDLSLPPPPKTYELDFNLQPTDSSAGMPYIMRNEDAKWSDLEVAENAVTHALEVMDHLRTRGVVGVMKDMGARPHFYAKVLKPKLEKQVTEKLFTKNRIYFVTPAWYRTLVAPLFDLFGKRVIPYTQDPTSSSALRTSMFYGGATALTKHMLGGVPKAEQKNQPNVRKVFYGDDASYVFAAPGALPILWNPDVAGMDYQTSSLAGKEFVQYAREWLGEMWGDPEWFTRPQDYPLWDEVIQFAATFTFSGPIHVDGPLWVNALGFSAASGMNGVSFIETLHSAIAGEIVNDLWVNEWAPRFDGLTADAATALFPKFKAEANAAIKLNLGFSYKDDDDFLVLQKDADSLPLPFIGFSTRAVTHTYVTDQGVKTVSGCLPVPRDPHKMLASLWLPGRLIKDEQDQEKNRRERAMGVYISGLGLDKELGPIVQRYVSALGVCPGSGFTYEVNEAPIQDDLWDAVFGNGLPSSDKLACLYLLPRENIVEITQFGLAEEEKAVQVAAGDLTSGMEQLAEEFATITRVQGGALQRAGQNIQMGPAVGGLLAPIDPKHVGGRIPLPHKVEQKQALEKLRAAGQAFMVHAKSLGKGARQKFKDIENFDVDEFVTELDNRYKETDSHFERLRSRAIDEYAPEVERYDHAIVSAINRMEAYYNYANVKGAPGKQLAELREKIQALTDVAEEYGQMYGDEEYGMPDVGTMKRRRYKGHK